MPEKFPTTYPAEADVTGVAQDEMNSLIYLDDIQGAPNVPEGAKKPSFLMSMLEMAPGYNPIQQMMEAGWDIADKGGGGASSGKTPPKDGKVGIEIINKLPVTQEHIRAIEKKAQTIDIKDLD